MLALRAALGLWLLGLLRAFPQDRPLKAACAGDPNRYYDRAAGVCCYRCPPGQSPVKMQPCAQGPTDCRKQCGHDYYLSESSRCTACVTCSAGLVEKVPCSWNTPRVCECPPGTYCSTSATNSCARCSSHSVCTPGQVVLFPGTAEKDTVCGSPPPVISLDCASPEDCKIPTSDTTPQAPAILMSPASAKARTMLRGGVTPRTLEDSSGLTGAPKPPLSTATPSPDPDPGPSPSQLCPQGSADCRKQCEPGYYLDGANRCTACLTCSGDLVEKAPCLWNSSRVCECRPGMVCATSVANSCVHCVARPVCAPGTVIKAQGVADSTHELPPSGTHPDCSTPESSEAPASTAPTLSPLVDSRSSRTLSGSTVSLPSTGKPILDTAPVLFWVIMVPVLVVASSFLLCHQRACRKRIRQTLHLCYPAKTFRPKLHLVDSRPRRDVTQPKRGALVTEQGAEEQSFVSPRALETCVNVGAACPGSLPLLDSSPAGSPSSPRDPPESRGSTEHTNNRIEKIYIMKADTVIVGTVKTEVSEGRSPAGPELEVELEVDHAPHYPEQETEPPLDSGGDVMFSVEEEGKEDCGPSAASGK